MLTVSTGPGPRPVGGAHCTRPERGTGLSAGVSARAGGVSQIVGEGTILCTDLSHFLQQRAQLYLPSSPPHPKYHRLHFLTIDSVGVGAIKTFKAWHNKGFSRPRHLQGKGCKTGLCGQAWRFPLFDPM